MDHVPLNQPRWTPGQRQKTYPCPVLESPEAEYVAICMLAGSKPHDITFGLACRFPLPKNTPPHHVQWVLDIWNDIRQSKPPYYLKAEQLVGWLSVGALLRFGSWELGILVFNGWDVSAENLEVLKRIRREVMDMEFNAAGVRSYLGQRSMMEGPQEGRCWQKSGRRPLGLGMGFAKSKIATVE